MKTTHSQKQQKRKEPARNHFPVFPPIHYVRINRFITMKSLRIEFVALGPAALVSGANATVTEHYTYSGLNIGIPDGSLSGVSDVQAPASVITSLSAVRVKLNIAGQYNGDLYAYLRHVTGTATNFCVLVNRPGRTGSSSFRLQRQRPERDARQRNCQRYPPLSQHHHPNPRVAADGHMAARRAEDRSPRRPGHLNSQHQPRHVQWCQRWRGMDPVCGRCRRGRH